MNKYPLQNRELSWVEFNARVLQEAENHSHPILERLKFLGIVSSNFDEFFMVRIAALKSAIRRDDRNFDSTGILPAKLMEMVASRCKEIVDRQYECLNKDILPALAESGIEIVPPKKWSAAEKRFLEAYFAEQVFPLLTPLRIEPDAFPTTTNLAIHCAFCLTGDDGSKVEAAVQVPQVSGRFIQLPSSEDSEAFSYRIVLIEDLVTAFASRLFPGHQIDGSLVFRVTRDADSGVDEDRQDDFLSAMEEVLAGRQNSTPVRLAVQGKSPTLVSVLQAGLGLGEIDTYRLKGYIDLSSLSEIAQSVSSSQAGAFLLPERFRDKPWPPITLPSPPGWSIWDEIEAGDRLLHLPYESFDPILKFIEEAADDLTVLAIKMTLYRTSGDSPVVKALIRAARNRKQVTAVVELKARFDEARNIGWASTLEQSGAIVTYGVAKLKVHAKCTLVIRKAKDGSIRKYLHLSTGNYNDKTARIYSDLSIFTVNEELCTEASAFFNMLTGYSTIQPLTHLVVAPFYLKRRIIELIDREIQRSTPESPGLIKAKLNALADSDIIEELYKASRAGVKILLNVRGACTLIPGLPGLSENIEVRSVLGRYLEHGRILSFRNGGSEEVYLSSADWLPRNFEKRIELMFPVLDERLARECRKILDTYFEDSQHSYRMKPDGGWEALRAEKHGVYAQEALYKRVKRLADVAEAPPEQLKVRKRFRT
jgi:polyphosphate kinase